MELSRNGCEAPAGQAKTGKEKLPPFMIFMVNLSLLFS
jgi:hypothetical protein